MATKWTDLINETVQNAALGLSSTSFFFIFPLKSCFGRKTADLATFSDMDRKLLIFAKTNFVLRIRKTIGTLTSLKLNNSIK